MRTTPHQWPLEMSEVSSTVFGLERADFTRETRLLDKVSGPFGMVYWDLD